MVFTQCFCEVPPCLHRWLRGETIQGCFPVHEHRSGRRWGKRWGSWWLSIVMGDHGGSPLSLDGVEWIRKSDGGTMTGGTPMTCWKPPYSFIFRWWTNWYLEITMAFRACFRWWMCPSSVLYRPLDEHNECDGVHTLQTGNPFFPVIVSFSPCCADYPVVIKHGYAGKNTYRWLSH